MIRRIFSLTSKVLPALVLATVIPLLVACGPSPDDALLRQAKTGDPVAQDALGLAYLDLRQFEKAVQWWSRAAEKGYAPAQVNLGLMLQAGLGVSKDPLAARRWYLIAAEQGDMDGQHNLAWLYHHGLGVERDHAQAIIWYRRAAQQGAVVSMTALGEIYAAGEGIPQDLAQALSWWRKAASHGNAGGWVHLANAYAHGNGVPIDRELAYAMLERARDTGPDGLLANWYEQFESQRASLQAFGIGPFTMVERVRQLEREGKVDAALAEPAQD